MKPSSYARISALAALSGSLALIGCGGAMTLPDAVVSKQVSGHSISGSAYGGHAPIVGMHVYLAQPGTSGYGSAASSILTTGTKNLTDPGPPAGAYYATSDSTGAFSFGPYTCTSGQPVFIYGYGGSPLATPPSGYTLGSGTTTQAPQTVSITGITVAGSANNGSDDTSATYTITVGSALPLTAGQAVTIAGLTGNLSILNGAQTATAATTGANTTFTITATPIYGYYTYSYYKKETKKNGGGYTYSDEVTGTYYETVGNGAYTATTGQAGDDGGGDDNDPDPSYEFTVTGGTAGSPSTGTGPFGTGGKATATESTTTTTYTATTDPVVQLASLGICDSAAFDALSYIYMNEVSTIAAAYTFQPFTLSTNNNAWDIGSSGTTQALMGIANAAETAAQLYAVQGSTQISVSDDGEGHLANYQTQDGGAGGTPNSGNGVVPQATIDSLANIIAVCIDSAVGTENSLQAGCTTLFNTATNDGGTVASGGVAATDTATAAINIARYPAGNNSLPSGDVDATYVSDLFKQQGTPVPYQPDLVNPPNDWTIAINYPTAAINDSYALATNAELGRAESVQVDGNGEIWVTAQTDDAIVRLSPLGHVDSYYTSADNPTGTAANYIYGYVSIDGSNNAWAGNADSSTGIQEFGSNGVYTATYGSGYGTAYTVIANQADDVFFFASDANAVPYNTYDNSEMWEYNGSGSSVSLISSSTTCDGHDATLDYYCISPTIFDAADFVAHGAIDQSGDLWLTSEGSDQIARVSPTGVAQFKAFGTGNTDLQPEFPAIDGTGSAWIPLQDTTGEIDKVTPPATPGATANPTITTLTSANTGATFNIPFGAAVDGNGNVWITNRCDYHSSSEDCTNTSAANNTIVVLNGSGVDGGTVNQAISPATNYNPEAQYPATSGTLVQILDDSLNLAIDPSGNVWVTNYLGNAVVEVVGAAAPVVTPLSVAAGSGKLGIKP